MSNNLPADLLATGVRLSPGLDQVFASLRKAKDAATDTGGVNYNVG